MAESPSPEQGLSLRAPRADEVDPLLSFIAGLNQPGPQHCLHFGETEAAIRGDVERDDIDVVQAFVLACDSAGWRGTVGLDREGEKGWLLGPWARDPGDGAARLALLGAVLAAPGLAQVRAFSNVCSEALNAELESVGFVRHSEVHVMQARRSERRDANARGGMGSAGGAIVIGDAEDGDGPALAALHDAAFPHTWLAGEELLAHARKRGALLVARDAARAVVGSLCLNFNTTVPEADVEFVAVQPQARGRGVGRALLQAALRLSFDSEQRACVNLCVNDANLDALRLYESAGFERLFTGAALRWLPALEEPADDAQADA